MKLAVVLHPERESSARIGEVIVEEAGRRGIATAASPFDASRVEGLASWGDDAPSDLDLIVAVGGDGTVLEAARMARRLGAPVLGVNAGTVGFLAEVEPARITAALDAVAAGEYRISERMTLAATMPDGSVFEGLNDAVVEKAVSRQVVRISVSVAGERLAEYRTDAVIVATPTGSTAYNFSAGGPLIDPDMSALVVTAVAPHNLFGRSIVFGPDVVLELRIGADRAARINIDGQHCGDLDPGDAVTISRGEHVVRLARLTPRNFARTVKDKFHLHDA